MTDEGRSAVDHLKRAALCVALLLSPVGGPYVAILMISICPSDPKEDTGMWPVHTPHCGLPPALDHYVLLNAFRPLSVPYGLGLGVVFFIVWEIALIAVIVRLFWHLGRAIWMVTLERL